MAIARRVLKERGGMSASGISEIVNSETRDGIHVNKMSNMLRLAKDIEKTPRTREPIVWRLKENVDAAEQGGTT